MPSDEGPSCAKNVLRSLFGVPHKNACGPKNELGLIHRRSPGWSLNVLNGVAKVKGSIVVCCGAILPIRPCVKNARFCPRTFETILDGLRRVYGDFRQRADNGAFRY